jgi:hypothetical protein
MEAPRRRHTLCRLGARALRLGYRSSGVALLPRGDYINCLHGPQEPYDMWYYHHNIVYQRDETNLADPFSRRPDHELDEPVLAPPIFAHSELDDETIQLIKAAYVLDPHYKDPTHTRITRLQYSTGLYYYASTICIPNDQQLRMHLLQTAHANGNPDHHAINKTLSILSKQVWWPGMWRDVKSYVQACIHCKTKRQAPPTTQGNAQFWDSVSLDFTVKLPQSIKGSYDAVAIFVETISKYVRIVPIPKAISGTHFATVFHETIFRHYGIPKTLLTAKSASFTTDLWTEFTKSLGTNLNLVTIFQSKSTTQSEYVDNIITYLHRFLTPFHKTWDTKLSIAEFAINTMINPSTGESPYSQLYNQHPNTPQALITPTTGSELPRDVNNYVNRWQTELDTARTALSHGGPWHRT